MEASSPQRHGDRAVLVSPILPALSGVNYYRCLSFWYNMHGASMGTLNVGVKLSNGQTITRWTLSGEQGSVWKFGRALINVRNAYYKVSL